MQSLSKEDKELLEDSLNDLLSLPDEDLNLKWIDTVCTLWIANYTHIASRRRFNNSRIYELCRKLYVVSGSTDRIKTRF